MEVIRVENISKLYDLGQVGTGTISKDLNRWWASVRGKEDPYARMGQTNDRTKKANKDDSVWALKDINFSINQGEVVGIIGRNGAGKSTLLKIISRITTPTTGEVKIKGRIASLLEVGTGFHPEMTGRENAFMNGTLLGMTRREVQSKLDQIIDFAGVELYIDTPVKRYSSGMQVRLAFAVAAFLEPEILIVDEVLAVGDAEFQKKAIGRMQEVSKGDGRTVLFVSHNMMSIKKLCNHCILLKNGLLERKGESSEIIDFYLSHNSKPENVWINPTSNKHLAGIIDRISIQNNREENSNAILLGDSWNVIVDLVVREPIKHFIIAVAIKSSEDFYIRTVYSEARFLEIGAYKIKIRFDDIVLASGSYLLSVGTSSLERRIEYFEGFMGISVSDVPSSNLDTRIIRHAGIGVILNPVDIEFTKNDINILGTSIS